MARAILAQKWQSPSWDDLYIVFCTYIGVLCRALSVDQLARKMPGAVLFHSGAMVVRAKPPLERNRLRLGGAESRPDCCSVETTSLSSRWPGKSRRTVEHLGVGVARV